MTLLKILTAASLTSGSRDLQAPESGTPPRGAAAPARLLLAFALLPVAAHAQAHYTAIGPGSYISVGVTGSAFQSDYGHTQIAGGTAYLDTNLYRRVGAEFEARFLRLDRNETIHQDTFLAGPKISTHARTWRPYAKFLAGRGTFTFPFHDAYGTYLVLAPGAGLDWRPPQRADSDYPSRFLIRIIDVEYQIWPAFTFGPLHPYGISTGLSYRIF